MKQATSRGLLLAACLSVCALLLPGCGQTKPAGDARRGGDEEVDVGYGTQDARGVSGSVERVSGEDAREPTNDVRTLLRGRVSGVEVVPTASGGVAVRIRGTTSVMGSNEPLYVVDGFAFTPGPDGELTGIHASDIDSIEVLKDASSTAIYGSRGANGVILIKTKRR